MLKAVIFDLNGIFLQSQKLSERFERDFGVPAGDFVPKLSVIMDKVRRPNAAGAFSYWKPILDGWEVKLTEKEFWDYWFKGERPSEQMISLARQLRGRGIKVFILSNNFRERSEYYGHYPWMHDAIDKVYFSWQTGSVKPDPKAWLLVLSENKLRPEECLYFDAPEKNQCAAESVGITSHIFKDEKITEEIIKALI